MPLLSKQKREIYQRKIAGFWLDFSHNKVGFAGLAILILFVGTAVLAPVMTPYKPASLLYKVPKVGAPYSAPTWLTILPQFAEANPTIKNQANFTEAKIVNVTGPLEVSPDNTNFNFTPPNSHTTASIILDLGNFSYMYSPPPQFTFKIYAEYYFERSDIKIWFRLKNYTAIQEWQDWLQNPSLASLIIVDYKAPLGEYAGVKINYTELSYELQSGQSATINSLFGWLGIGAETAPDPNEILFAEQGVYGLQMKIQFQNQRDFTVFPPSFEGAYSRLYIESASLIFWGRIHGLSGTNHKGEDVWTELVYGARISLMVGVLAAVLATSVGIFYGVVSGYLGGFVDEFLMRIVDVLLCIPVLPILLVLMRYFRPNVYWVVVLIAIFGWQGFSRVIRSRVLSLKEMAFVESARASGASDLYLMIRHFVPNVLPIAMAALVLSVPGAILTEASLSFLGFGDPNAPTWGRMLYHSYQQGGLEAWWTWLPPGLAITVICLGFVFIGHAVDEIVNPRLRRRR